jgi:hypothetical protein
MIDRSSFFARRRTFMAGAGRRIFAIAMSAATTYAIWVVGIDHAYALLGVPLWVCVILIMAAMVVVGLGLGARTYPMPGLSGFLPLLLGLIAVLPVAVRQAIALMGRDPASLDHPWPREPAILVFAMLAPCVAAIDVMRLALARHSANPS